MTVLGVLGDLGILGIFGLVIFLLVRRCNSISAALLLYKTQTSGKQDLWNLLYYSQSGHCQ
jgi:hypothetical protein